MGLYFFCLSGDLECIYAQIAELVHGASACKYQSISVFFALRMPSV